MATCSKSEITSKTCSDSIPPDMTAVEACQKVKDSYDIMEKMVDAIGDWSPAGIIRAIGASNIATVDQKNLINNIQTTIQQSNLTENCTSESISTQLNVIETTSSCLTFRDKMIETLKNNPEAQNKLIASWDITDITQENIDTTVQQCTLSATMNALSQQKTSIDNTALSLLMQKSSDLLASNDVNQNQCQVINNTQTVCNYLNTVLCCNNTASTDQSNILRCSGGKNVVQSNTKAALQSCNLTGTSTLTADQISALTNKATADTKQTAVGTSAFAFILLLLIPVISFGVIGGVGFKFFTNLMPYFGVIPLITCVIISDRHFKNTHIV